ncbi:MAG: primosomal protein N' [Chloroflexi bacterium]|nr:primosomal protein N' [Chloroflexota bacterium]
MPPRRSKSLVADNVVPLYAEVVVSTPIRYSFFAPSAEQAKAAGSTSTAPGSYHTYTQIFHYRVPPALRAQVELGQMVWVPFGSRYLPGVIAGFSATVPVEQVRDLASILDLQPVLTPAQLQLAHWMAQTYMAPLYQCIRIMLPPGVARRAQVRLTLTEKGTQGELRNLNAPALQVMELLRREGPQPLEAIDSLLASPRWKSVIKRLEEAELVERHSALLPPSVRPKMEEMASLQLEPGQAVARLLGPAVKAAQADSSHGRKAAATRALAWLLQSSDPLPAQEELCREANCPPAILRFLAEEKLVSLQPESEWIIARKVSPAAAQAFYTGDEFLATELAHALDQFRGPAPVAEVLEQAGISRRALDRAELAGIVKVVMEPPSVRLAQARAEAEMGLLQLQGLESAANVISYLADFGVAVPVRQLRRDTEISARDLKRLEEVGIITRQLQEVWRDPLRPAGSAKGADVVVTPVPRLLEDQQAAWQVLAAALQDRGQPKRNFLLHGVTGSGKTEIYLRAVSQVLAAGQSAIVLVPEISLTPQTVQHFMSRFPGLVGVWHSQLSPGARYDTWRRVRLGQLRVLVGSRSALFLPISNLGLIVLDEEHDAAYKQLKTPRYQARDAALAYGQMSGATVLLGSATPDVISYFRATQPGSGLELLHLGRRIGRRIVSATPHRGSSRPASQPIYVPMPEVEIVDLREELKQGNTSLLSRRLQDELAGVLAAGQQAIIFLNRRGAATFVSCRDCGYVMHCRFCDIPLTYHDLAALPDTSLPLTQAHLQSQSAAGILICHQCGREQAPPGHCPQCLSSRIRYFGVGTQRVVRAIAERFPRARVLRWDRDTTRRAGSHELLLQRFAGGEADILVGTQMVAKGLDLPQVTLVGIVSADTALHRPDYRAAERTFQLLEQVSGRAGRGEQPGRVVLQTYDPPALPIQAAARHDYAGFYSQELAHRRLLGYPPFGRLAWLVYQDTSPTRSAAEAQRIMDLLEERVRRLGLAEIRLLGPAPAYLSRYRGHYRWQIIVRGGDIHQLLAEIPFPAGWRIDIDPESLT